MRAVKLESPRTLNVVEVPVPELSEGEVLMTVSACGICGSDLHYWESGLGMDGKPGLILGHEFCGIVADPGSRTDLEKGMRITALPLDPCGFCASCLNGSCHLCLNGMRRKVPGNSGPGAYAEMMALRPDMVRVLPDSIEDREAVMIEPSAVALHAVHRSELSPGSRVLVVGGGPIGLLAAAWARVAGASLIVLTEMDPFRASFAERQGDVDAVLDARDPDLSRRLKKMSAGGFDAAIETSVKDAGHHTALGALKPGGILTLAGISFAAQQVATLLQVIKEIRTVGAFAYTPREFETALHFIAMKRLSVGNLVTKEVGLDGIQSVFETLSSPSPDQMKVMLRPQVFGKVQL
jgi:L-iditol 2-dehydrogenase